MDGEDMGNSDEEWFLGNEDDEDNGFLDDQAAQFRKLASCIKVITKQSLLAAQNQDLGRVMDLLSVSKVHARTLLIHFCWNVDALITVFIEQGKEKLYEKAGLKVVEDADSSYPELPPSILCIICMEEVSSSKMTTMDCGHYFCNDCWTGHFVTKIHEGKSKRIGCMAYKCSVICDEDKIRHLVNLRSSSLAKKYNQIVLNSYIEDNKLVKWCPSVPHCGNAIRIEDDELCEVECTCGQQFCFGCSAEAHSPCSCLMWKVWVAKSKDDMTCYWIKVNTIDCPSCHKPVEKRGGCNIVHCVCGNDFCWLCGEAKSYNHNCSRYKEKDCPDRGSARKRLDRYRHYNDRYNAHLDSLKLEHQLEKTMEVKILNLEEQGIRDTLCIKNALYRLFRSRRILSYSYPLAYYMFDDELSKNEMTATEKVIKKNLFEDLQQQLEETVEKLSMEMEKPFDQFLEDDGYSKAKQNIVNLSVSIDHRCKKLYDWIENDLFGSLRKSTHRIAPYNSRGVEKASEISDPLEEAGKACNEMQENTQDSLIEGQSSLGIKIGLENALSIQSNQNRLHLGIFFLLPCFFRAFSAINGAPWIAKDRGS